MIQITRLRTVSSTLQSRPTASRKGAFVHRGHPNRLTHLYVVGRIRGASPRHPLSGHRVVGRLGGRVLAESSTDGAGRFLLEWSQSAEEQGGVLVELLDPDGRPREAVELTPEQLVSPSVIIFEVRDARSDAGKDEVERGAGDYFEADGDSPVTVTAACQEVSLSWGSRRVPLSRSRAKA